MTWMEGIHSYQNRAASNAQSLNQTKETIRPLSSYAELTPGKVFEGTVTERKNGQVTILLSDGQTVTARMEQNVALQEGEPMMFEVKSSSPNQIALRPIALESAQNPTLWKALEAAGLKATPDNLTLVSEMMRQQMPIHRESLLLMSRAMANLPGADVQTLVQMQKAGLPLTEAMFAEFQNYKVNQQSFLPQIQQLLEEIPNLTDQMLADNPIQSALGFHQQLAGILAGTQIEAAPGLQNLAEQSDAATASLQQEAVTENLMAAEIENTMQTGQEIGQEPGREIGQETGQNGGLGSGVGQSQAEPGSILKQQLFGQENAQETVPVPKNAGSGGLKEGIPAGIQEQEETAIRTVKTAGKVLTAEKQQAFLQILKEFPAAESGRLFTEGKLNTSLTAAEMLSEIMKMIENSTDAAGGSVQRLLHSETYQGLLRQAMEDAWLLEPEQLKQEGAVKELYQRLGKHMEQLERLLSETQQGQSLAKSAQSVQSNLEFMHQVNQAYTYVQVPLKLMNQNAHSDLYVYTNKKNLRDREGQLTALLHLDLEHLGSTDVYVKMLGNAVDTTFYLENERSYQLILGHIPKLQERLEAKGYFCTIGVENRKKQQDFVQDFLEQERPAGRLRRYSFDVKA